MSKKLSEDKMGKKKNGKRLSEKKVKNHKGWDIYVGKTGDKFYANAQGKTPADAMDNGGAVFDSEKEAVESMVKVIEKSKRFDGELSSGKRTAKKLGDGDNVKWYVDKFFQKVGSGREPEVKGWVEGIGKAATDEEKKEILKQIKAKGGIKKLSEDKKPSENNGGKMGKKLKKLSDEQMADIEKKATEFTKKLMEDALSASDDEDKKKLADGDEGEDKKNLGEDENKDKKDLADGEIHVDIDSHKGEDEEEEELEESPRLKHLNQLMESGVEEGEAHKTLAHMADAEVDQAIKDHEARMHPDKKLGEDEDEDKKELSEE